MADDVLANAGHQQPAPNINNNDTTMSYSTDQNKEDNKMEEEVIENNISLNRFLRENQYQFHRSHQYSNDYYHQ
jgi:hypothetical protein